MFSVQLSVICSLVLGFVPGVLFIKTGSSGSRNQLTSDNRSDEEIIIEYTGKLDKKLIGVLFDRYIHLVFASCMKYMKNEENAQDAAMEIFESLSEKLLKYKIEHFKSWLYTTTRNYCLMEFRKKKPFVRMEGDENLKNLSVEFEDVVHPYDELEETEAILAKYLSELKQEQKTCIEMMYLKGMSYKEIAAETGFDLNNVKSFIQNGKRNLRIMLEQYYEQQGGI